MALCGRLAGFRTITSILLLRISRKIEDGLARTCAICDLEYLERGFKCTHLQKDVSMLLVQLPTSKQVSIQAYLTFRHRLNSYKSEYIAVRSYQPHNYSFFVNQINVFIYCLLSAVILAWRAATAKGGPRRWWRKQSVPFVKFAVMGLLDASSAFLSTMGGTYTDGSLQNLLNQCVIPLTILMSAVWLREHVTCAQAVGSGAILVGTAVSVFPALLTPNSHTTTTAVGVSIFSLGIIPCALSNVYKEAAFRHELRIDLYLLSLLVAIFQCFVGFFFTPILALPAFGGLKFNEMPNQLVDGWKCFLGEDPQLGDHCGPTPVSSENKAAGLIASLNSAPATLLLYCLVNFAYNVFSLLVTKHGSAILMVVSAALALPLTNIAFASEVLMGDDAEPFTQWDVAALLVVVIGFIVYSSNGVMSETRSGNSHDRGNREGTSKYAKLMPIQGAGGSMMYIRERSNSDPNLMWSPNFALRTPESRFGRYSPATRLSTKGGPPFRIESSAARTVLPQIQANVGEGLPIDYNNNKRNSTIENERAPLIRTNANCSGPPSYSYHYSGLPDYKTATAPELRGGVAAFTEPSSL